MNRLVPVSFILLKSGSLMGFFKAIYGSAERLIFNTKHMVL